MMKRTIPTRATARENKKLINVPHLKRKGDQSPEKGTALTKRLALGDITNAKSKVDTVSNNPVAFKKPTISAIGTSASTSTSNSTTVATKSTLNKVARPTLATSKTERTTTTTSLNGVLPKAKLGISNLARATVNANRMVLRKIQSSDVVKRRGPAATVAAKLPTRINGSKQVQVKTVAVKASVSKPPAKTEVKAKRLTNEFNKINIADTDKLEELKSAKDKEDQTDDENKENIDIGIDQYRAIIRIVPDNVADFDLETRHDMYNVPDYAYDVFEYLKSHEYVIEDYLPKQRDITSKMRRLLIDWMVEIQDNFELTHETLYLSVKMVDLYLNQETVTKDTLQLIGAVALFMASKYEEKIPPLADDFVYVCDGSYSRSQLFSYEKKVFKTLNCFIGYPLSYRFLRRYARCARISMPILTLARYVLESSLLDSNFVSISDSKLAAASLYLAIKMEHVGAWTPTLEYFSGYTLDQIMPIVLMLNSNVQKQVKMEPNFVKAKYSTELFYEVAKKQLLDNAEL